VALLDWQDWQVLSMPAKKTSACSVGGKDRLRTADPTEMDSVNNLGGAVR
jgi:hypothetical protein